NTVFQSKESKELCNVNNETGTSCPRQFQFILLWYHKLKGIEREDNVQEWQDRDNCNMIASESSTKGLYIYTALYTLKKPRVNHDHCRAGEQKEIRSKWLLYCPRPA